MSEITTETPEITGPVVPEDATIHAYQVLIECHECIFDDGRPLQVASYDQEHALHLGRTHVHRNGEAGLPTHAMQRWHASAPLYF